MPCYPIKQVESEELDKNIDVLCEYYLRMGATMPWSESIQHQQEKLKNVSVSM